MSLPTSKEECRGLRAAMFLRESTAGQFDRFGPGDQRRLYGRALDTYGLVDSGLEWASARSGKTVYKSPAFREMLDAAVDRRFDVLVTAYVDRFQRNLRQTLNVLEDVLHPAGVPVIFAKERLLSSDPDDWEEMVQEALDAEKYVRRLAGRVAEGLAEKRRVLRDPGGHPPFGFKREGDPPVVVPDPATMPLATRMFELSASGMTDHEVAAALDVGLWVVRGSLTNPMYIGRVRRDGGPTAFPAPIDADLWSAVQERRSHRRTRTPGSPRRGFYALKIRCQGCGLHLRGDTRRYRHPQPICDPWLAAQPRVTGPRRGRHTTSLGHSYAAEMYEGLVEVILRRIGEPDAALITQVVGEYNRGCGTKDDVALARIGRERDVAMGRYLKTRDSGELDATMRRLDAEQDAASTSTGAEPLSPEEVVAYLRDLPRLWRDASPEARQLIAASLFEETSALGWRVFSYRWTAHAIRRGLGDVIPGELHLTEDEMVLVGARGIAPRPPTFRSRCGSLSRPSPSTGCGPHEARVPPRRRASDGP